jgi:hypothetical protein
LIAGKRQTQADALDRDIAAANDPDRGAVFTLTFPGAWIAGAVDPV